MANKGPYTRGKKTQMTPGWKDLVRRRLGEAGMSQSALEVAIGAGRGQVAKMLSEEQNTSVWVAKVCEALLLPPPGQETQDEASLLANFRAATAEGKRALLQHAAAAAGVAVKPEN